MRFAKRLVPSEIWLSLEFDINTTWSMACCSFANVYETVTERVDRLPWLSDLIDDWFAPGHGVILAMGKGGVGKSTIKAAVSLAIAERGYEVHLSTNDPAAHIAGAMNGKRLPNFTVSLIDPRS